MGKFITFLIKLTVSIISLIIALIPILLLGFAWIILMPSTFWEKLILVVVGLFFGGALQVTLGILLIMWLGYLWLNDDF